VIDRRVRRRCQCRDQHHHHDRGAVEHGFPTQTNDTKTNRSKPRDGLHPLARPPVVHHGGNFHVAPVVVAADAQSDVIALARDIQRQGTQTRAPHGTDWQPGEARYANWLTVTLIP
jgi:hypothetical protein